MVKGSQDCLLVVGGKVVAENGIINHGYVLAEADKIIKVGQRKDLEASVASGLPKERVVEVAEDCLIMPGFIDLHLHGLQGADVMDGSVEALSVITRSLPSEGVTSFLPTTMTAGNEVLSQVLRNTAAFMGQTYSDAEILGIHLEGPFISPQRAGAQALENMIEPDLELFDNWFKAAEGKIRLVTLAPEQKGAIPLIKELKLKGVLPAVGHSEASLEVMQEAIARGLAHATHLFNGMPTLHHREPGVVGATLINEKVRAEIIFDGIHVVEEMVELAYRLKGSKGLILVTDAIRAKGLGNGEYELGGQRVLVQEGVPRLGDGTLAGSVLRMNEAVKRAHKLVRGNLLELVRLSSLNAAEAIALGHRKGTLTVGKDADIVVLDKAFEVKLTVCRGKVSYITESSSSIS